jgi:hypothetical protein
MDRIISNCLSDSISQSSYNLVSGFAVAFLQLISHGRNNRKTQVVICHSMVLKYFRICDCD